MEESFETTIAADGFEYDALIAFEDTEEESYFKIMYKTKDSHTDPDAIEIVFEINGTEEPCWQQRQNNTCFRTDISKEFLDAAGIEIENHYESFP